MDTSCGVQYCSLCYFQWKDSSCNDCSPSIQQAGAYAGLTDDCYMRLCSKTCGTSSAWHAECKRDNSRLAVPVYCPSKLSAYIPFSTPTTACVTRSSWVGAQSSHTSTQRCCSQSSTLLSSCLSFVAPCCCVAPNATDRPTTCTLPCCETTVHTVYVTTLLTRPSTPYIHTAGTGALFNLAAL